VASAVAALKPMTIDCRDELFNNQLLPSIQKHFKKNRFEILGIKNIDVI
jgi:hypothetical protein